MADPDVVLQTVESLGGSLSIISCLYMGYKIMTEGVSNLANWMLSFLFIIDFILGIAYVIGRSAVYVHGLCQFQALIIQWFSVVAILWAVLMAFQMRQWIVKKRHPKRIESAMRTYMLIILVVSFVLAIALLGAGTYGNAYLWCWITPNHAEVRFICFDLILFASWAATAYFLWEVSASIHSRMKHSSVNVRVFELLAGQDSMQRKLILYVCIFFIVWFMAILNRLLEWGAGRSYLITAFLQAFALSLQGFWNAIAFTDALGFLSLIGISSTTDNLLLNREIKPTSQLREVLIEAPKYDPTAKRTPQSPHSVTKKGQTKQYSIFVTTLNMGEAPLLRVLPDLGMWILKGHDIYAVGVQECLDIAGVSDAILQHLGRTEYCLYRTLIGSGNTTLGYHGFISLMLFVRATELRSGAIVPTMPAASTMATGADLVVTTAQNKGAVGLPLQIHDTNISFVTCHLPSDSKGASKLTKRNASAHAILRGLTLSPEDVGFDLHLQHDHVLVFGDMNYRMDSGASGGGMGSLSGVAVACLIEKSAMQDDKNWHTRRYNLMRPPSDPLFPTVEEIKILKAARTASRGAWSSVLRADELRAIMADGDAFAGFEEPMPCFPPSYKRKKGSEEGDCGDYTDPLRIIQGFTNTGEVQELDVSRLTEVEVQQERQKIAAKKLRPPSYTDRVLIHSLPDRHDRLTVQSYDFCDQLRVSDHRAVSMTVRLEVNTGVQFQNHTPVLTGILADTAPDPTKEPHFQLYELSITDLHVALDPGFSTTGKPGEADDDDSDDDTESDPPDSSSDSMSPSHSRSADEGDDGVHTHYVGFGKDGATGKAGSTASEPIIEVTTNPLLSNPVADAALRRAGKTRSGRGVKFAEEGETSRPSESADAAFGVSIEMAATHSPPVSPSPSPSPSPAPSPARPGMASVSADSSSAAPASSDSSLSPSPSPSPSPSRPSPAGRPGMLVRAKSANAAVFKSADATAPADNASDTDNSSSLRASDGGVGALPAARKPRFLSRLSMALTGSNAAALTEAAAAADRQRTDAVMSRSLIPRKNRNRSIFGAFLKPDKPDAPVEDTGDIISELTRESMAWEGDSQEAGQWKKRVAREAAERRAAGKKRHAQKIVSKIKKNKKLKKNSKKVAQVVIVFPLPVKDPLLAHRKLYDFSHAYNIRGGGDIESNIMPADSASHRNITREELLRPLSVFPWIEDSRNRPASVRRAGPGGGADTWSSHSAGSTSGAAQGAGTGAGAGGSPGKLTSKASNLFRVTGCASPELGAHALLKFLNPSGYELGSAVVSLSHLLHTSTEEVHATQFANITIASGGQQRGSMSGKFSLKYLPSLISGDRK